MSLLDSLTSQIKGVFGGSKAKSVLGIDIGSASIKVVQLRGTHGAAILETYGEIALGPYAGAAVGKTTRLDVPKTVQALQDLMRESSATATHVAVSIPFSSSLISVIELPHVDEDKLRHMIPIEARKYIPVPVNEVALDWFVIPEDTTPDAFDTLNEKKESAPKVRGIEVLLVAIHNETLQRYQAIMETAGLHTAFYEIEVFSAIRSSLPQTAAPVCIIDIGASTTKIYVVERGVVRTSHLLNDGSQHLTETLSRSLNWSFEKAERLKRETGFANTDTYSTEENERIHTALETTLDNVFAEANRVMLSFGKRYNKNVVQAVFLGGGAALPGFIDHASKKMSIESGAARPFNRTETPAFLESVLKEIGPGFSIAVGLALRALQHD